MIVVSTHELSERLAAAWHKLLVIVENQEPSAVSQKILDEHTVATLESLISNYAKVVAFMAKPGNEDAVDKIEETLKSVTRVVPTPIIRCSR